jgi:uncharacterized protein YkwD
MDLARLERLIHAIDSGRSRREVLTGLLGGVLVSLGFPHRSLLTLTVDATERRRNKRKRKREKERDKDKPPVPASPPTVPPVPILPDDGANAELNPEEATFLTLLNDYRAAHGLQALSHSLLLSEAAEIHSADMAMHNITGHTGSDGSTSSERIARTGYESRATSENVYWGFEGSATAAFTWWQYSPLHNAEMLSPLYTETGIGSAYNENSDFHWYWTNTFALPLDVDIPAE